MDQHAATTLHDGGRQRHHERHVGINGVANQDIALGKIREIRENRFPCSCGW